MSTLEKKLRQLCTHQDNVTLGIEEHDEYMVRRSIRLRDTLIKTILAEYEPERPSLLLVAAQPVATQDAR